MLVRTPTAFLLVVILCSSTASAQPAPFNDAGVTMGHWHLISKDVDADRKIFLAMGGKLYMPGGAPLIMFPGLYVNLILGGETGDGGTVGSVVNHVGVSVDNLQVRTAQWKAAGVNVLPGDSPGQAFVVTPDGVRIEITEDQAQTVPIRNSHVHFALPAVDIPRAAAWYAKTFGGTAVTRDGTSIVVLPGVELRFSAAARRQAPTRKRILDHFGFDVQDHAAFVKRLEVANVPLDEPVHVLATTGNTITYITDRWGTRVEIVQRAPIGTPVQ